MDKKELTRRAFLATATTTAAISLTAKAQTNTAKVVPGKVSPNEKINVAAIGAGGKGGSDIYNCRHENVVALCDVDWDRATKSVEYYKDAKRYT